MSTISPFWWIKLFWRCSPLDCWLVHVTISSVFQKGLRGWSYYFAKSVFWHVLALFQVKCLPRRENEVVVDEVGIDKISMLSPMLWILYLPSLMKVRIHPRWPKVLKNCLSVNTEVHKGIFQMPTKCSLCVNKFFKQHGFVLWWYVCIPTVFLGFLSGGHILL